MIDGDLGDGYAQLLDAGGEFAEGHIGIEVVFYQRFA